MTTGQHIQRLDSATAILANQLAGMKRERAGYNNTIDEIFTTITRDNHIDVDEITALKSGSANTMQTTEVLVITMVSLSNDIQKIVLSGTMEI